MAAFLALAAAFATAAVPPAPFGRPISDDELALAAPGQTTGRIVRAVPFVDPGYTRIATAEAMDCWWAYEGTLLIAELARPTPTMPAGFDPSVGQANALSFRIAIQSTTGY